MKIITDESALGDALKRQQKRILVGGPLGSRLERLYTMNQLLWYVCLAGLAVTAAALIKMKPRDAVTFPRPTGLVSDRSGASVVGKDAMTSAALVAEYGGGIQVLEQLKKEYDMERMEGGSILFIRNDIREGAL